MYDLFVFAQDFPSMSIADGPRRGDPLSWRHYVYALRTRNRRRAAEQLALHDAVWMASPAVKQDSVEKWRAKLNLAIH